VPSTLFLASGESTGSAFCKIAWGENTDSKVIKLGRKWFKQYYTIFEVDETQQLSFELGKNADAEAGIAYIVKGGIAAFSAAAGVVVASIASLAI